MDYEENLLKHILVNACSLVFYHWISYKHLEAPKRTRSNAQFALAIGFYFMKNCMLNRNNPFEIELSVLHRQGH